MLTPGPASLLRKVRSSRWAPSLYFLGRRTHFTKKMYFGTANKSQAQQSPPLYQSPNRWVPATPTTADEYEETDTLGEMNFIFQNSEIKTKEISSQQVVGGSNNDKNYKTGSIRTYNTI